MTTPIEEWICCNPSIPEIHNKTIKQILEEQAKKEVLNKKEPHVSCERCQKDITNLIYNRGDQVIIDLSRYEIQRGNEYMIAPYCKECIEIIKKEMIKNDD